MDDRTLAATIDHTLLKAEATGGMIDRLCDEAVEHGFAAVCVNPVWVQHCADRIGGKGSHVAVATVVGFPLGASLTAVKVAEAELAIGDGAQELDVVLRVGDLIDGELSLVSDDIAAVVDAARSGTPPAIVKVILETAALTAAQIAAGCRCAVDAGADYVKTSTGFHAGGGASVEAVRILRDHAPGLKVKAAGGIRDRATAEAMLAAGAARLGCSASVQIIRGSRGGKVS